MTFALSLPVSPVPDLPRRLEQAKSLGFDGVELCGLAWSEANPFPDAQDLRQALADAGLSLLGVEADAVVADLKAGRGRAWRFEETLGLAWELQSPWVKLSLLPGPAHRSPAERGLEAGPWLEAMAAVAAGQEPGMMILLQNGGALPAARDLWLLLDRLNHPLLAAAYHTAHGLLGGESPPVALALLNRRVKQVTMQNLVWTGDGPHYAPLEAGAFPLDAIASRLLGMGFDGTLSLPAKALFADGAPDSLEHLREDLQTLRAIASRPGPRSWAAEQAARAKPTRKA